MTILIIWEPAPHLVTKEIHPALPHLLGAGRQLGQGITILVVGSNSEAYAERFADLPGVTEVIWSFHPAVDTAIPSEDLAQLVADLAPGFSHILASASTFGAEIIPRIGALLAIQPITGVVEIRDHQTFVRPIHAGSLRSLLRSTSEPILLTIQPWAFTKVVDETPVALVRRIQDAPTLGLSTKLDFTSASKQGSVDLSTAQVVVAGGGGLNGGGSEAGGNFSLVEQLAQILGGAVGASRTAVDAGLAPVDRQIGQTGRIIAPRLYIALGISGAIQHLAGIKDAGIIVAINTDGQAPMACVADLALIADLYEAVPALIHILEHDAFRAKSQNQNPGG